MPFRCQRRAGGAIRRAAPAGPGASTLFKQGGAQDSNTTARCKRTSPGVFAATSCRCTSMRPTPSTAAARRSRWSSLTLPNPVPMLCEVGGRLGVCDTAYQIVMDVHPRVLGVYGRRERFTIDAFHLPASNAVLVAEWGLGALNQHVMASRWRTRRFNGGSRPGRFRRASSSPTGVPGASVADLTTLYRWRR